MIILLTNPWFWFAVIGLAWVLLPAPGLRRRKRWR
jgi:hypothetical protein